MIRITTQTEKDHTIVTIDGDLVDADLTEIRRIRKSVKGEVFLNLRQLKSCALGGAKILQEWLDHGANLQAATPYMEMILNRSLPNSHCSKTQ